MKQDPNLDIDEQKLFDSIRLLIEESYLELKKQITYNKSRIQERINKNKSKIKSNSNRKAKMQIILTFEQILDVIKKDLDTNSVLKYHETISTYHGKLSEIIDSLANSCKLKKIGGNKYKSNTPEKIDLYYIPKTCELELRSSKISSQEDALKIVYQSNLFKDLLNDMKSNIDPIVNRIKEKQEKENQPPPFVFNRTYLQIIEDQEIALRGDFI